MAQQLMVDTLCMLPSVLLGTTGCDKDSTADHISSASLTTPRGAHLITVIVLSRSHLVLTKIGSKTPVELTVQRGHIPWILAAQVAATDQGEDPCDFRTINTIHSLCSRAGQTVFAMLSSYALQIRGMMIASRSRAILAREKGAQLTLRAGWALSSPCWG